MVLNATRAAKRNKKFDKFSEFGWHWLSTAPLVPPYAVNPFLVRATILREKFENAKMRRGKGGKFLSAISASLRFKIGSHRFYVASHDMIETPFAIGGLNSQRLLPKEKRVNSVECHQCSQNRLSSFYCWPWACHCGTLKESCPPLPATHLTHPPPLECLPA